MRSSNRLSHPAKTCQLGSVVRHKSDNLNQRITLLRKRHPSSSQVVPKWYPSGTQVQPSTLGLGRVWLHYAYTMATPWVCDGYATSTMFTTCQRHVISITPHKAVRPQCGVCERCVCTSVPEARNYMMRHLCLCEK